MVQPDKGRPDPALQHPNAQRGTKQKLASPDFVYTAPSIALQGPLGMDTDYTKKCYTYHQHLQLTWIYLLEPERRSQTICLLTSRLPTRPMCILRSHWEVSPAPISSARGSAAEYSEGYRLSSRQASWEGRVQAVRRCRAEGEYHSQSLASPPCPCCSPLPANATLLDLGLTRFADRCQLPRSLYRPET